MSQWMPCQSSQIPRLTIELMQGPWWTPTRDRVTVLETDLFLSHWTGGLLWRIKTRRHDARLSQGADRKRQMVVVVMGGGLTLLDWYQTLHTVSDTNRVTLLICHLNKLSRVVMHQQYRLPPGGWGEEDGGMEEGRGVVVDNWDTGETDTLERWRKGRRSEAEKNPAYIRTTMMQ